MAFLGSSPENRQSYQIQAFCLLASCIIALVSAIAIIATGVFVARPGIWAQDFINTTCSVSFFKEEGYEECSCGDNCHGKYPCAQVFVKYQARMNNDMSNTVLVEEMVHLDETYGVSRDRVIFYRKFTQLGIILSLAIPGTFLAVSGLVAVYLLPGVMKYLKNLRGTNNTFNIQPNQTFQQNSYAFNSPVAPAYAPNMVSTYASSAPMTPPPTYNSMFRG